jgi:Protein of unknown function (DUF4043)
MSTHIPTGSGLAPKGWSEHLFTQVGKMPTPVNTLSGEAPDITKMGRILRRQSTTDMPIVRVSDLSKSAGDTVRIDCAHIIKVRPVMGDENAEGKGAKLDFSFKDCRIDMATLPVSAGGKMTQKRFQHDLRVTAVAQLKGAIPNFEWQRCLVQMAGARGQQDGLDWILPLASDPEFDAMIVNPVKAPTYNRHFVVNGANLTQGGAQLASVASTDVLKLDHIDLIAAILKEHSVRMLPVNIPGDRAAMDSPIRGILMLDNQVWSGLLRDTTTGNNLRTWQTNALERAKYGNISAHPLFSPGSFLWNDILVRGLGDFSVRFFASASVPHITAANRYTATETNVTVAAGLSTTHQVCRNLLLGAQALAFLSGVNSGSGVTYSMLENRTNFGRNLEMAGELICAQDKLRFSLPDGQGNLEPTDIGALVIDSVAPRLAV